jgi:alpha-tubulin suppressor-like RCC1 family protein
VYSWGSEYSGRTRTSRKLGSGNILSISCCNDFTSAVTQEGGVKCMGHRSVCHCASASVPNAVAVQNGLRHSAMVQADGQVTCWGENVAGQCIVPSEFCAMVYQFVLM